MEHPLQAPTKDRSQHLLAHRTQPLARSIRVACNKVHEPNERRRSRPIGQTPWLHAYPDSIATAFQQATGQKSVRLTGSQATKDALKNHVTGKQYVHLATHGWFSPESTFELPPLYEERSAWLQVNPQQRLTGIAPEDVEIGMEVELTAIPLDPEAPEAEQRLIHAFKPV